MNFTIPSAVKGVGALLRDRILPEIGDNYAANMARMASAVLSISANWADNAAALRVAENAAIRSLLGEAAGLAQGDLAGRLAEAAKSADPRTSIFTRDHWTTPGDSGPRLRSLSASGQRGPPCRRISHCSRNYRLCEDAIRLGCFTNRS